MQKKEFDEIWAIDANRIESFFRDRAESVKVIRLADRKVGNLSFPQTRVIISCDDAEELHRQFVLQFISAGG